ncbi:transcription-repair coupling factor [Rothia sp. P13129]|uniref:transcription-repair coupling factor n=1 Tax=Rothia sp. P13129 TaxID=3402664 RepID=UPI003AC0481B
MSLTGLTLLLETEPTFARIGEYAAQNPEKRTTELAIGTVDGARPPLIAHIATNLQKTTPQATTLVITATEREAEDTRLALESFLKPDKIALFPAWETLPHERLSPRSDTVGERLSLLRKLKTETPQVIVAPIRSIIQPIVDGLEKMEPVTLRCGEEQNFEDVIHALQNAAYSRVDLVSKRGEYAVRGGMIDLFSPTAEHPARIEFFGDEIENIRWFSVADQRTITSKEHPQTLYAPPCRELLITPEVMSKAAKLQKDFPGARTMLEKIAGGIYVEGMESLTPLLVEKMTTFIDVLPTHSIALLLEPEKIRTRARDLVATNDEFLHAAWDSAAESEENDAEKAPLDVGQHREEFNEGSFQNLQQVRQHAHKNHCSWWSMTALGIDDAIENDIDSITFNAREPHSYAGKVEELLKELHQKVRDGWRIVAVTAGNGPLDRLIEVLHQAEIPATRTDSLENIPDPGIIELTTAQTGKGFMLDDAKIGFLTEADILGRTSNYIISRSGNTKLPTRRRKNAVDPLALKAGDYVVHEQHGIGQFIEMIQRPIAGTAHNSPHKASKEYLVLEYAPSKRGGPKDRLFVPADQLDQVSHYVGSEAPTLSKMGGSDWAKTKSRARKAVKEIAADLIKLYSARQASKGHAFSPDTPWQRELEEAFPYNETPDQLSAINDVKADMEREIPMDRLICGDVGYGKTEIAVRAAFKAVQDGKQVAVLVPTTLLAQQHYETFSQRFSGFPVRIRVLSRFQKAKETKEALEEITQGSADIIIGTHRLFSQNVEFKDLGLIIIDEEQRFGVEHKEKLKQLRTNVDVLAMSATPIPRTLEMSLTGIRETSTLATAPEERHPVLTYVGARTNQQITAAIRREIMREGQVFFVHNRVSSIESVARELQELVPEARIAIAHGRMSESRLEQIIVDFWERKFDVLVCTTIVETGLDISNANTLIVDQAQNYGLSQLHQLRGRVGRGRERAYAYFLYPPEKLLGTVALERLKAVATHNELGSGMQLAMKDLELRGAGNLLGGEQSGHIAGVGFDLYLRLVGEAITQFRSDGEEEKNIDVKVDIPVNAHFPHEYISSERLRLAGYRQIAQANSEEELNDIREELKDRYGELPEPVENLLLVASLRIYARSLGVQEIVVMGTKVRFYPVDQLAESRQMRLERMYPDATYRKIPESTHSQILLPRPKTARVGGKDLSDRPLIDWVQNFLKVIIDPQ